MALLARGILRLEINTSMAFSTTSPDNFVLTPEQIGEPLLAMLVQDSVAVGVTTNVRTSSISYRVPVVAGDPTASWLDELEEIGLSDPTVGEAEVTPSKLGVITKISRELVDDSDGVAVNLVAAGVSRELSRKIDQAFFTPTPIAKAPEGLHSIPEPVIQVVEAQTFANLDPFEEAIMRSEQVGGRITSFVANPSTALELATLKESSGSNRSLLQPDPTQPTRKTISGVPLVTSPYVEEGTVWAIPGASVMTVVRTPFELATSEDVYFTQYAIAIRATARVGFLFPHAAAIVRIGPAVQSS